MSADNGLIVTRLWRKGSEDPTYGIFYYGSDDFDPPGDYFVEENAWDKTSYTTPLRAMTVAHKIQNDIQTEYGVYVHSMVVSDCLAELGLHGV